MDEFRAVILSPEGCHNPTMDAFKLVLVSLAGWMNHRQQHVIEYLQEEVEIWEGETLS